MLYPIFDLTRYEKSLRWYVTALEEVIIQTVAKFGIQAHRSTVNNGVWVSDSIYCITARAMATRTVPTITTCTTAIIAVTICAVSKCASACNVYRLLPISYLRF